MKPYVGSKSNEKPQKETKLIYTNESHVMPKVYMKKVFVWLGGYIYFQQDESITPTLHSSYSCIIQYL